MDREISKQVIKQRRRKRLIKIAVLLIGVVTIFAFMVHYLQPSLTIKELRVATVDRGVLSVSVSASGKVLPIYEEIIASPISSKIVSIKKKSGEKVIAGEPILELDLESFSADVEKQRDELELKNLKLEQFKITTRSALDDLAMQIKIDGMKLERMEVLLRNELYLDSIGASTTDKIKQIQLEYEVQKMQFNQLNQKFENQKRNSEVEIKAQELDYKVAVKSATLLRKVVKEASVSSPRNATLTWVNDQIGTTISAGSQLAIVSDLENYRIDGEIMDSYSDKISSGNRVEFKLGNEFLTGVVGNIAPSVSNGVIKFSVAIDKSDHERLRSGLKVDLYVINSMKEDVLRIDNYSYYVGVGEYDLWVMNDGQALKRRVKLGESSFDKVEVVSGLKEGDRVILSDMSRYNDRNQVSIR